MDYKKSTLFLRHRQKKEAPLPVCACTRAPASVTINDRDIDDYFGLETLKLIVRQPLNLTEHRR